MSFEKLIFDIKLLCIIFLCVLLQESVYANESIFEKTVAEIIRESLLPSVGKNGRPLPLIGHWNRGQLAGGYTPQYQFELIKNGHHLLPWFHFPMPGEQWNNDYYAVIEEYRKLNLPISFVGTQWERILSEDNSYLELDEKVNPNVVNLAGNIEKKVSPFGRKEDWRDVGKKWTDNRGLLELQNLYPKPPLILFISNNEHNKLRWYEALLSKKFIEKYGLLMTPNEIKKIVGDNWIDLYAHLFDGMLDGIKNENWKNNSKFIGYDAFLDSAFARWPGWLRYSLYIPGRVEPWSSVWDGASVSYYTHNWNESTDFRVMSPQIQAMNLVFALDRILEEKPGYWFELSVWDGHKSGNIKDKRVFYNSIGHSYNTDRYAGYVKFGMWLLRPRVLREFRDWSETVQNSEAYFLQLANAVNSLYGNHVLERFWRYGELVENVESKHPYQSLVPDELRNEPRWFLLTSNVNQPMPWSLETSINVYSLALSISSSGNKEWLIYNYSPLKDYCNIKVVLPGYGEITVGSSPSGEFYYVNSLEREIEKVKVQ